MPDKEEGKITKSGPRVAPGFSDAKFGQDASPEDKKTGNVTRVTRVFLDENDPSRKHR
jgi:hypothetical protein